MAGTIDHDDRFDRRPGWGNSAGNGAADLACPEWDFHAAAFCAAPEAGRRHAACRRGAGEAMFAVASNKSCPAAAIQRSGTASPTGHESPWRLRPGSGSACIETRHRPLANPAHRPGPRSGPLPSRKPAGSPAARTKAEGWRRTPRRRPRRGSGHPGNPARPPAPSSAAGPNRMPDRCRGPTKWHGSRPNLRWREANGVGWAPGRSTIPPMPAAELPRCRSVPQRAPRGRPFAPAWRIADIGARRRHGR